MYYPNTISKLSREINVFIYLMFFVLTTMECLLSIFTYPKLTITAGFWEYDQYHHITNFVNILCCFVALFNRINNAILNTINIDKVQNKMLERFFNFHKWNMLYFSTGISCGATHQHNIFGGHSYPLCNDAPRIQLDRNKLRYVSRSEYSQHTSFHSISRTIKKVWYL